MGKPKWFIEWERADDKNIMAIYGVFIGISVVLILLLLYIAFRV